MSTKHQHITSILLGYKDRSIGLKISRLADGSGITTLRVVGGKNICLIPLRNSDRATDAIKVAASNLGNIAVKVKNDGKLGQPKLEVRTDIPGFTIDDVSNQPQSPAPTPQGWLGNLFQDVTAVVSAAATAIVGGEGKYETSGGGLIVVSEEWDTIAYHSRDPSFKAEDGLEEDPNIWY